MTLLFFFIFSSALFNYGIGLQSFLLKEYNLKRYLLCFLQVLIELFLSLAVSWFFIRHILLPIQLTELFPLIVFLVFYLFHTLISFLVETIDLEASNEIFLPVLILIMSFLHSMNFSKALIISLACHLSYFLAIPILYAIRLRIDQVHPLPAFKTGALVLISLAVIMISLYAFDLSVFFQGVF